MCASFPVQALQLTWASAAALHQRKGRAGRVRPGMCFSLVSKARFDTLPQQSIPEMLRVPLEDLVLQAKVRGTFTWVLVWVLVVVKTLWRWRCRC